MYPRCCRINFGFYSSTLVDKEPILYNHIIQPILYKQYYINEFLFKVRTHFLYAIKTYNSYSFSKPVSIINVATWAALSGSIG